MSRTDDATADAVSARKARRFFPSNDFHTIKCFENQTFGRKKKRESQNTCMTSSAVLHMARSPQVPGANNGSSKHLTNY